MAITGIVMKLFAESWSFAAVGWVFEQSCLYFAKDSQGNTGACLLYDRDSLRISITSVVCSCVTIATLIKVPILWFKPAKGSTAYDVYMKNKLAKEEHANNTKLSQLSST